MAGTCGGIVIGIQLGLVRLLLRHREPEMIEIGHRAANGMRTHSGTHKTQRRA